jgi:hypothetical protein
MRLMSLFVLWLVFGSSALAHGAAKAHVRFFNDSAKAAAFYIDNQFGCSIPANPEENDAYCDAPTGFGRRHSNFSPEELSDVAPIDHRRTIAQGAGNFGSSGITFMARSFRSRSFCAQDHH